MRSWFRSKELPGQIEMGLQALPTQTFFGCGPKSFPGSLGTHPPGSRPHPVVIILIGQGRQYFLWNLYYQLRHRYKTIQIIHAPLTHLEGLEIHQVI